MLCGQKLCVLKLCVLSIRAQGIENCNHVIPMGRLPMRTVDSAPGARLDLAVLVPARRSCVAVDLATNAVLRVHHPRQDYIAPFTVVRANVSESTHDRLEQPESIDVSETLQPIGRIMGLRCERLLRSIDNGLNRPTLGFVGPGISLWELDGSRPSVEIIRAPHGATLTVDERGVRCRFAWLHGLEDLPIEDVRLLRRLDWLPSGPLTFRDIAPALGYRPTRFAVALSRPKQGYCYKVIAALLP